MSQSQLRRSRGLELELGSIRRHGRRPCRPPGPQPGHPGPRSRASIVLERLGSDGALLRVGGELDIATLPALDLALRSVERWAVPSLLVDTADVGFVDLSVIGWLAAGHARLRGTGGGLLVVHPPDCLLRILDVIDVELPVLI